MRSKSLELTIAVLTLTFLIAGRLNLVQAEEQDFNDNDGIVEDEKEEETAVHPEPDIKYESPQYDPEQFYFIDHFDNISESSERWIKSEARKDDIAEEISKYDGKWSWESPKRIVWSNDIGLVLKSKAKHAAIASKLTKSFTFKEEKPLVVQYEVTMQEGQECGGSYIKLLSADKNNDDLTKFNDKTPYTIMFGPDKCGNDHKMHFIFRHVNPINGSITEKHCRKPKQRLDEPFKDRLPHLYTLIVRPDNSFEMRVDNKIVNEGSLLSDFSPPVNPPAEIDDPTDKKPEDWDEREKIPDPTAQKPEDWDEEAPPQIPDETAVKPEGWLDNEPEMIPDPEARKPEDWDTEMDGEWEAPLVNNPACEKAVGCGQWKAPLIPNKDYKGKWRAPLIDNKNYKGKWTPRKIPNPDYFEDLTPFRMTPIDAVGIELWSMSSDILFDNLIITDDVAVAEDFGEKTFKIKRRYIDKEAESVWGFIVSNVTENPWVWKVAIVLLVTLLSFTIYRLFSRGSRKDGSAEAKKTDAVQPDDIPSSSGSEHTTSSNAEISTAEVKPKKSDLDVKTENDVERENEAEVDNEEVGTENLGPEVINDHDEHVGHDMVEGEEEDEDDDAEFSSNDEKESDDDGKGEAEKSGQGEDSTNVTTEPGARKRRVRKDQS